MKKVWIASCYFLTCLNFCMAQDGALQLFFKEYDFYANDVNFQREKSGWTALIAAINAPDDVGINAVEPLLKAGANPNILDEFNLSAMHYASSLGRLSLLKLLIKYGADPCIRNKARQTPLDMAKLSKQNTVIAYLENFEKTRVKRK